MLNLSLTRRASENLRKSLYLKLLVLLVLLLSVNGYSQIYFEDFGDMGDCSLVNNLANGYDPGQGTWTVSNIDANGPFASEWYISPSTAGEGFIGGCSEDCGLSTQNTLHIGANAVSGGDLGAVYFEFNSGLGNTSKRAESPTIDCSNEFNNLATFVYTSFGMGSIDDLVNVVYSPDNGANWFFIQTLPATPVCGIDNTDMIWGEVIVPLPAAANNNPAVKIGIEWVNVDNETVNERPSVAIDLLRVDGGAVELPTADFSVFNNQVDFCEQSCITFIDESTFGQFSDPTQVTYQWSFPGGTPNMSNLQNPSDICYNEPGTYDVSLIVTDNLGSSPPAIQAGLITVQDCGPEIIVEANLTEICLGEQSITFNTDNSLGDIDNTTWEYTFTSDNMLDMFTVSAQNPTVTNFSEIGTYDVLISVTDINGITEVIELFDFFEVIDCFGPEIAFSVSQQIICPGDCIQFTDESTSGTQIIAWNWTLDGGQAEGEEMAGVSTQQNPTVCYALAGTYWAVLSATDLQGETVRPDSILITVDPCTGPPDADFSASETVICAGDCVDFQNESLGFQSEYLWSFSGVNIVSTDENPSVICYDTPGTYDVTLVVTNEVDVPDSETKVDYITVENCINPPVPRFSVSADTICAGKCVNFTNESTGLASEFFTYEWVFAGTEVGSETSIEESPSDICYNEPGSYDVSLKVVRPNIPDSAVSVFSNVVTVINTQECRPQIIPNIPDTICSAQCSFFSADFIDADSVRWTFNGGVPETSTAFVPGLVCFDEPGEYIVIVQAFNESGESLPEVRTVVAAERPPLDAGPDFTINAGAEITLNASLGGELPTGSFLWQPFELVDNFRAQTVRARPDENTAFIVFYEDSSCTAVDTVNVTVNFVPAVGVPNSFSPNGDGINDVLRVLGQGIARMEFKVFNRYGQLVFETENQSEGWDGLFNDRELNAGTFVYTLEVLFAEGGSEVFTGDVTLVR